MKLVCPSCGATASAEAWNNDATAREAIMAVAVLPSPLHVATLRYLSLFRPTKSALGWKKVLRLVQEVDAFAKDGYVAVQGQIDRDCSPQIWAAAMEDMVARQTAIKRPLKNHNYLRQVAWGMADTADRQHEAVTRVHEKSGTLRESRPEIESTNEFDGMTADDLSAAEIALLSPSMKKQMGVE